MSTAAEFVDWRELATCLSEDPELFFPISGSGPGLLQEFRAKAVCVHCPVRQRCLDYALDTHQPYGVWGGLSEHERQVLLASVNRGEIGRAGEWPGYSERLVGIGTRRPA
jgi:WhiB family transcriptional regulator, redox-sensing transcriptional regulator